MCSISSFVAFFRIEMIMTGSPLQQKSPLSESGLALEFCFSFRFRPTPLYRFGAKPRKR
jgi:hypothetical protein